MSELKEQNFLSRPVQNTAAIFATAVDGSKIIFLDDLVSFMKIIRDVEITLLVPSDNHDLDLRLTLGEEPQNTFNNSDNSPGRGKIGKIEEYMASVLRLATNYDVK
jgi:hypothetical protein